LPQLLLKLLIQSIISLLASLQKRSEVMKSPWLVGLLLLTNMSGVGVALAQTPDRLGEATAPAPAEVSDRVLITPQTFTLKRGKPGADHPPTPTAKIQYPTISGIKDPAVLAKVQAAVSLKTMIGQSLAEIQADLADYYWLVDIHYTVNYNENFLLDLTYQVEGCGAYCSQSERHTTVDLKTGKKLRSHDIFKRETLGMIAAKVDKMMQVEMAQAIAKWDKENVDIRPQLEQAKFRVKHVDDFAISDKGVTFRYDFGFPHVAKVAEPEGRYFFTYTQLKSYIRPEGPLGSFVQ
jgi:hypothetical protein